MGRGSYKPPTRRLRTFLRHPQPANRGAATRSISYLATQPESVPVA